MKKILFLVSFIFLFLVNSSLEARSVNIKYNGKTCLLYLPSQTEQSKPYPVILIFHPTRGDRSLIEKWKHIAEDKGYLLAFPVSKDTIWYTQEAGDIIILLEEIASEYKVDTRRIYIAGFSGGAVFTYFLGINHPEYFAAMAPVGGYMFNLHPLLNYTKDPQRQIPLLLIHGAKDTVMSTELAKQIQQYLDNLGYAVTYQPLANMGHEYPAFIVDEIVRYFQTKSNFLAPWLGKSAKEARQKSQTYFGAAEMYFHVNHFDKAIEAYKKSIELYPLVDPGAYSGLGAVYGEKGIVEEQFKVFKRGLELFSDDAQLHTFMAMAYYESQDFVRAEGHSQLAIALDANHPLGYYVLSLLYAKRDKPELAIDNLKKAITLDYDSRFDLKQKAKTEEDFENIKERKEFQAIIGK